MQIRVHPEFKTVSPAEKAKVMKNVKSVMPRSEELKKLLKVQYDGEYQDFQQILKVQQQKEAALAEELRKKKMQQEGENLRKEISKYHDEKIKTVQMQRDLEVAMWHQMKIDHEEQQEITKR